MADRDEKERSGERGAADEKRRDAGAPSRDPRSGETGSRHEDRRESGEPGGGQGRRDEVGGSKVYPMSGTEHPADAELRTEASWGQGERGAAGYEDSGGSELVMRDGELLGGMTAGPDGRPTIDIHGDDREGAAREAREKSGSETKQGESSGRQAGGTEEGGARKTGGSKNR